MPCRSLREAIEKSLVPGVNNTKLLTRVATAIWGIVVVLILGFVIYISGLAQAALAVVVPDTPTPTWTSTSTFTPTFTSTSTLTAHADRDGYGNPHADLHALVDTDRHVDCQPKPRCPFASGPIVIGHVGRRAAN